MYDYTDTYTEPTTNETTVYNLVQSTGSDGLPLADISKRLDIHMTRKQSTRALQRLIDSGLVFRRAARVFAE